MIRLTYVLLCTQHLPLKWLSEKVRVRVRVSAIEGIYLRLELGLLESQVSRVEDCLCLGIYSGIGSLNDSSFQHVFLDDHLGLFGLCRSACGQA